MEIITGRFSNWRASNNESSFHLKGNTSFNPYTFEVPIIWKGSIDDELVQFVQIGKDAWMESSFDWTGFPQKFESSKSVITKAIDDAMRIMD